MHTAKRIRLTAAVLVAGASIGAYVAVTAATADAGAHHGQKPHHHGNGKRHGNKPGPSVTRFNLDGYVIDAKYTLGRNTGNTFRQTYTGSTVQGVPTTGSIKPFVSATYNGKKGTHVLMADGSIRFVTDGISDALFQAMTTYKAGDKVDKMDEMAPLMKGEAKLVGGPKQ